jgi:DNA-binding CsgD family transcriptional regulator
MTRSESDVLDRLTARLGASDWPLIGRGVELATADRAMAQGQAGVVFAGDSGVGKTRVAREALERAAGRGHETTWLTATAASSQVPLGIVAHLTGGIAGTRSPTLLARVAWSLGSRPGSLVPVIGIDDAHRLDDASAVLAQQLALNGLAFLVVVVRTGMLAPDPLTALWKEGRAERVDIQALPDGQVALLVEAMLGAPVDMATQRFIRVTSAGNVLFVREIIVAGLASGALRQPTGVWTWEGPLAVSARLADVVAPTLGRLEPGETEVLEILAHGQPMEARLLESWCGPAAFQAAERVGLIRSERSGRRLVVRLSTPLHEQVIRARTAPMRARAIQHRLADGLEATRGRRLQDPLRIAALRLAAGDPAPVELLAAAAERAFAGFECELAEALARAGAEAGGGIAASTTRSRALHLLGRDDEAMEVLAALETLPATDVEMAADATQRAQVLCWGLGRGGEAAKILARAEASVSGGEVRDGLRAVHSAVLLESGEPGPALALARSVLERPGVSERTAVPAALTSVLALASAGRVDEALATADRWTEVAWRLDGRHDFALGPFLPARAVAQRVAGRLRDAVVDSRAGYARALLMGDWQAAAAWITMLGRATLDRGQVVSARRVLNEALTVCRHPAAARFVPVCQSAMAEVAALTGDLAGAHAAVAGAEAGRAAAPACFRTDLALARCWLAVSSGDILTGRTVALAAAATAEHEGRPADAVIALHTTARLGDAEAVHGRLDDLSRVLGGTLAPACAGHAGALMDRDGPGLDRAAAAFDGMGAHLLAAEAAAAARSVHRAEGRRGSALSSSDQVRLHLERCEGAQSPGLAGFEMIELTAREQEVATLAAGGLSSREVARRLSLSVRTVDNHLRATYDKLGVHGRHSLPGALRPVRAPDGAGTA